MITAEVSAKLSAPLRYAAERLEGVARIECSQAMGEAVQMLSVAHLQEITPEHHKTAEALGATPSGYFATAIEALNDAVITADEDGVSMSVRHPVIARAFRDITIVPTTAKALAIPINAIAYNQSPRALKLQGHQIFRLGGKGQDVGKNVLAEKGPDGSLIPLYILVASVTQLQDRELMPSDDEMAQASADAIGPVIKRNLLEAGLKSTT